jgi:integrase
VHAVVVAYCWRVVAAEGVKDADDKLRMMEPKTRTSRRTVVLPRLAIRHPREHQKRQKAQRLALGEAWREHGLVFASTIGTPIEPRNINRRWDELRKRAGLDSLRLHDLRHGCAAFIARRGGTLTDDHGSWLLTWARSEGLEPPTF